MSFEKLQELQQNISTGEANLLTMKENFVDQAFAEFFQDAPEVTSVHWTQYTPYFNDGDECKFSINGFSANFDPQVGKFTHSKLLGKLEATVYCYLEDLFGDHVEITATREGFTDTPYDHE